MNYPFRQTVSGKFRVDVHRTDSTFIGRFFYNDLAAAKKFADAAFEKGKVFKVQVWDISDDQKVTKKNREKKLQYERTD